MLLIYVCSNVAFCSQTSNVVYRNGRQIEILHYSSYITSRFGDAAASMLLIWVQIHGRYSAQVFSIPMLPYEKGESWRRHITSAVGMSQSLKASTHILRLHASNAEKETAVLFECFLRTGFLHFRLGFGYCGSAGWLLCTRDAYAVRFRPYADFTLDKAMHSSKQRFAYWPRLNG